MGIAIVVSNEANTFRVVHQHITTGRVAERIQAGIGIKFASISAIIIVVVIVIVMNGIGIHHGCLHRLRYIVMSELVRCSNAVTNTNYSGVSDFCPSTESLPPGISLCDMMSIPVVAVACCRLFLGERTGVDAADGAEASRSLFA